MAHTIYFANCTQQKHSLAYRLPGAPQTVNLDILPGRQQPIGGGELTGEQVDSILKHQRAYGATRFDEGSSGRAPLIYRLDEPVPYEAIARTVEHNRTESDDEGEERRARAAVAIETRIGDTLQERQLPDRLQRVEVSHQEDSMHPEFAKGVRVQRTPEAEAERQHARRNRPRKA